MFLDNSLTFNTSLSSSQTITATADSTSVIDITGAGSGTAPAMINGYPSANTAIGVDYGVGDGMSSPYVLVFVTATTTVTGVLSVSLSAAPDDGSYGQGSYTVLYTSAQLTGATQLAAGKVLYFPVPPTLFTMGEKLPRFYKLVYTVVSGSISLHVNSMMATNPSSFGLGGQYNNNFLAV